jgi:Cu2+-exporting ATPase
VVWTLLGQPDQAVVRVIAVLLIACPHALGLAIPLVVAISTERSARAGVLIKDRRALERMRTITTVVFDKTGTLTKGQPALTMGGVGGGHTEADVLTLAAAAETDSEHPLARAIVRAAQARNLQVRAASGFSSQPALGVSARVDDSLVRVGGPRLLDEVGVNDPFAGSAADDAGLTRLYVLSENRVVGALSLADEVRPESADTVAELHRLGVRVAMITGDAQPHAADRVAAQLGIDTVLAEVRPDEKAARVMQLQAAGEQVAMVGDGVNDAPALAQADVGLAIGAGTDVAIASAGVILAGDDPRTVVSVIELSKASYRKMVQNLWWAAGYNLVSVPLAAGVLAPVGVTLPMEVGAVLMSLSTVVVALNAQLLRRLDQRTGLVSA